jgi:hypothetical protein
MASSAPLFIVISVITQQKSQEIIFLKCPANIDGTGSKIR